LPDEPTGISIPKPVNAIVRSFVELAATRKKSLLIVTHDSGLATRGRIVSWHIKSGRIQ